MTSTFPAPPHDAPSALSPPLSADPDRVGPYRVVGRLGAGGMGVVYAGLDADGVRAAVKVVRAEIAEDTGFRARFRREADVLARVHGPGLVPLLAADPDAERPWLATAYVPGPTLQQYVDSYGPPPEGLLRALAVGTATALETVHAARVVHRDLKPGNVILGPDGPCVLDFGIAHALDATAVTRTGTWIGSQGWVSPEQYEGRTAGPAADLFAWGALMAYAATGAHPFGTGAPDVVAFRIMREEPDLSVLGEPLRPLVHAALRKDPADRPSAADLGARLAQLPPCDATQVLPSAASVAAFAPLWPTAPTARTPKRRRRAVLAAAAAGAVLTVGATAGYLGVSAGSDGTATAKGSTTGRTVATSKAKAHSTEGRSKEKESARQADAPTRAAAATEGHLPDLTFEVPSGWHLSDEVSGNKARLLPEGADGESDPTTGLWIRYLPGNNGAVQEGWGPDADDRMMAKLQDVSEDTPTTTEVAGRTANHYGTADLQIWEVSQEKYAFYAVGLSAGQQDAVQQVLDSVEYNADPATETEKALLDKLAAVHEQTQEVLRQDTSGNVQSLGMLVDECRSAADTSSTGGTLTDRETQLADEVWHYCTDVNDWQFGDQEQEDGTTAQDLADTYADIKARYGD
ncbi:serine/threonine-protein kinase [Streptomyces sp. NBC_00483]|uniref:serine/threonine-protein kinase n=1 Tax=Streptomyces sp. NBC_00483 TaxID=2975756 RepID=UPI002E1828FE